MAPLWAPPAWFLSLGLALFPRPPFCLRLGAELCCWPLASMSWSRQDLSEGGGEALPRRVLPLSWALFWPCSLSARRLPAPPSCCSEVPAGGGGAGCCRLHTCSGAVVLIQPMCAGRLPPRAPQETGAWDLARAELGLCRGWA